MEWWNRDSIGPAFEPRCGGCCCGNCRKGDNSLSEERELEQVRNGLSNVEEDRHCKEPHWHTRYPWTKDPAFLPNNRKAFEATFLRTERQLAKEPEWKIAYSVQVHDNLLWKAEIKLSKKVLENWTRPVWYISHLIAPNPHSVTIQVRLVCNSS